MLDLFVTMPRKTRQQKMASKLRQMKIQLTEKKNSSEIPIEKTSSNTPIYSIKKTTLENTKTVISDKRIEEGYIAKDIRKIIILTCIALGIEIGLSLTLNSQFAKLLLSRFGIEI